MPSQTETQREIRARRKELKGEMEKIKEEMDVLRARMAALQRRCSHPNMRKYSAMGEIGNICDDCGYQD